MKNKRKSTMMLVVVIMVVSLLAGCGGSNNSKNNTAGNKESNVQPKSDISIMMPFFSKEPPANNEAIEKIEQFTNSKVNVTWVPANGYPEKLNATIASGTLPKVMVVMDMKAPIIVNSAQSGMFWELGSYLKDYEHLAKLNEIALKNSAVEGKIFSIPRERVVGRNGLIIRKDWLNNLGLEEPKTVDDLYEVIKQFATNDPDKNGTADTYGLTENKDLNVFNYVLAALGGANEWLIEDGKFKSAYETDTYMEALQFVKKLIDEKLLNRDFAIYPNRDDDINNGRAGISFNPLDTTISGTYAEMKQLNTDGEFTVLGGLDQGEGKKVLGGTGFNGTFMIPKSSVKTEEELKEVLTFMNDLMEEPMIELFTWGIEGKHFTKENDTITVTNRDGYVAEVDPLTQLVYLNYNYLYTAQSQSEIGKTIEKIWAENEANAVHNPAQPFTSPMQVEKGTELTQLISDARVKFLLGEMDEAGWSATIEQWKSNGGTKIAEELTASYAALQ
ncbi:extracellular solute-binding protein [Paenibacillus yanchengensis]|uniref:Extracellular solute-binding protein n=1 Tax=Paenibacillus yanchengensis TaxID=2035833 RepID=A0ABW4YLK1_9BACL